MADPFAGLKYVGPPEPSPGLINTPSARSPFEGLTYVGPANYEPEPKPEDTSVLSNVFHGFTRGVSEGVTAVKNLPSAFEDREPEAPDNSELSKILATPVSEGWRSPEWWLTQIAHGAGASAPALALGGAAALSGGGLLAGAGAFALGSAITAVAPAYDAARAENLSHNDAVIRAMEETGIAAVVGGAMGVAPGLSVFGRVTKAEAEAMIAKPLGEALAKKAALEGSFKRPVAETIAQIGAIQPAIGAAGQLASGAVAGRMPTADELGTGFATNVGMGAAFVGAHALLPKKVAPKDIMDSLTVEEAAAKAAKLAETDQPLTETGQPLTAENPPSTGGYGGFGAKKTASWEGGRLHFVTEETDGRSTVSEVAVQDQSKEVPADKGNTDPKFTKYNVTPQIMKTVSSFYKRFGIEVVFVQHDPALNFDGAFDPSNPNTLFLSTKLTRAASQIAGHEVTHFLEKTFIDTGSGKPESLVNVMNRLIKEGATDEFKASGYHPGDDAFDVNAPKRGDYADGDEGGNAHATDVINYNIQEFGADLGSDALHTPGFAKLVSQHINRLDPNVARVMLRKLVEGFKEVIDTVRNVFSGEGIDSAGESLARKNVVTNLTAIHDALAQALARQYLDNANAMGGGPRSSGGVRTGPLALGGRGQDGEVPRREGPLALGGRGEEMYSPKRKEEEVRPFFSTLTRTVENSPQTKATPGQWLAAIKNTPGVKSEEVRVSGVEDWLKSQTQSVTREALVDYIRAHETSTTEVVSGGASEKLRDATLAQIKTAREERSDWLGDQFRNEGSADRISDAEYERTLRGFDSVVERLETKLENYPSPTAWGKNAVPGGTNYTERKVTLPARMVETTRYEVRDSRWGGVMGWRNYPTRGAADIAAKKIGGTVFANTSLVPETPFRSTHFQEPNIVVHSREQDRVGVNGEKIREVPEIQSDMHQRGLKEGYILPEEETRRLLDRKEEAEAIPQNLRTDENWKGIAAINDRLARQSVPDHPFKATEAWVTLGFKHVLRAAVADGMDVIHIDSGLTNAKRAGLGEHFSELTYAQIYPDVFTVVAVGEKANGERAIVYSKEDMTAEGIKKVFGKEMLDTMKKSTPPEGAERLNWHDLKGLDAYTGHGIIKFYDEMVVSAINKYVKKWGAKVERYETNDLAHLDDPDIDKEAGRRNVWRLKITPDMRSDVAEKGQTQFSPRRKAAEEESARSALAPEEREQLKNVKSSLDDLERIIPLAGRVAGKFVPGVGTVPVAGGKWSDKDLTARGQGAKFSQADLQRVFTESLDEMLNVYDPKIRAQMIARKDAFMRDNPGFSPNTLEFWDKAFRLPDRARYWYEVSSEAFSKAVSRGRLILSRLFDVVAATSAQANPTDNLRRSLGLLAEEHQNLPIKTDITDASSVRKALSPQALSGSKTGSFSQTFSYILGLTDKPPLSVNDRQVASTFGITGEHLMQEPWLYGVISKFYEKLRDVQNAGLIAGGHKGDLYETWQMQALGWVEERASKNAAKGVVEAYDDYALVMNRFTRELSEAGVDTSEGLFSDKVLSDPRVPNLLSGTREAFMGSRIATLELATKLTPEGLAASKVHDRISAGGVPAGWRKRAIASYERIQRRAMNDISGRRDKTPSVIERLFSAVAGRKMGVTRLDGNAFGTFNSVVSPNLRIPLLGRRSDGTFFDFTDPGMETARRAVLAALGKSQDQEASAASKFDAVAPGSPEANTFTLFVHGSEHTLSVPMLAKLEKDLGFSLNAHAVSNGLVIDINVGGVDTLPKLENVKRVAEETFPASDVQVFHRIYESDYLVASEYDAAIDLFWEEQRNAGNRGNASGLGRLGPPKADRLLWNKTVKELGQIARKRDRGFAAWTAEYAPRIQAEQPVQTEQPEGVTAFSPKRKPVPDYQDPAKPPTRSQPSPVAPEPARPVETPAPAPKPATEAPTQAAPARQSHADPLKPLRGSKDGEVKVRGVALSTQKRAVAQGLTQGFGDLPEYTTSNNIEQAQRAVEFDEKNPSKLWDALMGRSAFPPGILPATAYVHELKKAEISGDAGKTYDLITKSVIVKHATTEGQNIQMLSNIDRDGPGTKMQALIDARRAALKKKGVKVDALIEKDVSDMTRALDAEIAKTAKATKRQSLNDFIMSIVCKI